MTARTFTAAAILAATASLATSGRADAQWYGPYGGAAIGVGYGPRVGPWVGPGYWGGPWYGGGYWGGPYWGYPGFWGPGWGWGYGYFANPVAGTTPGTFGGADAQRGYVNPSPVHGPSKDFPTQVLPPGYRPRFATADVRRRYDAQAVDPLPAIERTNRDVRAVDPYLNGRWCGPWRR